jgi:hypothetical protein
MCVAMKATLTATMTMGAASETTVAAVSICIGGNHGGDDDNYSGHCYGGSTATIAWSIRISLVDPTAAIVVVRTSMVAAAETMSSAREVIVTMTTMVVATVSHWIFPRLP